VDIDEGVIWDVSQRFQTVEQSSQAAADRLSMEYYKNKVGQCIELCKEQLLDDNLKFGSQSQAEEAFNQHLVRSRKATGVSHNELQYVASVGSVSMAGRSKEMPKQRLMLYLPYRNFSTKKGTSGN
jgi:hypothetical protein